MRYPKWIPHPVSVLNAFALAGLMSFYFVCVPYALDALAAVLGLPYRLRIAFYYRYAVELHLVFSLGLLFLLVFIVLPISSIAFPHHWLHLFLSRFVPKAQAASVGITKGWFPGLMSWWESLWGWFVAVFGLVLGFGLSFVVLPGFWVCPISRAAPRCMDDLVLLETVAKFIGFVWIVSASYLYQLLRLVEVRLFKDGKNLG